MERVKKGYKDIRVIIASLKFSVINEASHTSYKSSGTLKVFIGISPIGTVSFISDAFPEPISDVDLARERGFLDRIDAGDRIVADTEFKIKEMLYKKGARLVMSPFALGKGKLTTKEDMKHKCISRVCVQTEKNYQTN